MTTEPPGSDGSLRADALAGLTGRPKSMPPKWFYDARGSRLFERITELPAYYLTRAETEILAARAPRIAADTQARTLVELGSGAAAKTRLLLAAMTTVDTYVPVDVDPTMLTASAAALRRDFPNLQVRPMAGDFQDPLRLDGFEGPRVVAFLGSTIGNLLPAERARFLRGLGDELEPGDALLLGVDLVKDPAMLLAAYDDEVTAAFNQNLLAVLNRRLGADFRLDDFAHRVVWDAAHERIEMRLQARRAHTVKLPALVTAVHFEAGEALLTETSAKFRRDALERELADVGLEPRRWWTDTAGRYALSLAFAS